ncbi:MAG: IclR family transcriptional regulator C-terminal domain-containing protein [Rhizobiaceae bacterium]
MAGLAKGLAIIESFGETRECLTVTDAAQVAGISRASARRCLLTLADLGYLIRNGSQFHPTPRMLRLGAAYYDSATLPQLAQIHLDRARDDLQESISLAILEQGHAVFIARSETKRIVSSAGNIGQRLPAYASATGRILLASLPDGDLNTYLEKTELVALTKSTIINIRDLTARIRQTSVSQVEVTDEELEEGLISMAVPVKGQDGETVAAMSMSASSARITADQMKQKFYPTLMKYADALSKTL